MADLDETVSEDPTVPQGVKAARELVGTMLGSYRIDALLGEGAMGTVFRATHIELHRQVALKALRPEVAGDRTLTERFFAEARAVNIIRHENIVECTDLVDEGGRSYIVMELLEGKTLGAAIREAKRIPPQRAVHIAAQIADAIGAAHGKGIVHRDLKPENVFLIKRAGSPDYVKVLDFGIARLRPEHGGVSTATGGALIGTPAYMSPEQARGEPVGPAADIYALGGILFHMLTGRVPFELPSLSQILAAQLRDTPARVDALVPEVPAALADLVAKALAKAPADRPADMGAFRAALLAAAPNTDALSTLDQPAASGNRPASKEPDGSPRPKKRWWLVGIPIAALIGVLAFAFGLSSKDPGPKPAPADAAISDPDQDKFDAERRPDRILAVLGIQPGWRVADVGADTGKLTVHLARAVGPKGKVIATDVDAGLLELLAARVKRDGLADRVIPREVGPDAPGLEPEAFDLILVAHVDHYFGDPAGWLTAAKAALKPGGKLVLSNRLDRKGRAMAAADKAGLELVTQTSVTPTDYIAVFVPGKPPDTGPEVPMFAMLDIKQIPGGLACAPGTPAMTPTAVDQALAEIKQRGNLDDAALDKAIAKQGLNRAQYRAAIQRQLEVLGCKCPKGYAPKRDKQSFAICSRVGATYMCQPYGKPDFGAGCSCMEGYESRLKDNVYSCEKKL